MSDDTERRLARPSYGRPKSGPGGGREAINLEAVGNDMGHLKTTRRYHHIGGTFSGGANRYHHFGGTFSRPFKSAFLKSLKRVPFDTALGARIPTVAAEAKHGIRRGSLFLSLGPPPATRGFFES